uniref:HDC19695 n=1 Tax=Drosophila melanogaster TaxID=7227 RepID=Q6II54_DROME|nr:TPA_inf: HDC19695 [Drosophila melanogaster]
MANGDRSTGNRTSGDNACKYFIRRKWGGWVVGGWLVAKVGGDLALLSGSVHLRRHTNGDSTSWRESKQNAQLHKRPETREDVSNAPVRFPGATMTRPLPPPILSSCTNGAEPAAQAALIRWQGTPMSWPCLIPGFHFRNSAATTAPALAGRTRSASTTPTTPTTHQPPNSSSNHQQLPAAPALRTAPFLQLTSRWR